MNRRAEAVEALRRRLGHEFADPALLERALTHPSAGDGAREVEHYQVLEFLGDRVLGLLAAEALLAAGPHWREGDLSRRQVSLVSGPSCAKVARSLGLGAALRLAGSSSRQGERENDRILGDAMEAVVAAVYLDGGLEAARSVFNSAWKDLLSAAVTYHAVDGKTALNEWAMARGLPAPTYAMVSRAGAQHAPVFTVSVTIEGHPPATAEGSTLRAAEKDAAAAFLAGLEDAP